MSKEVENYALIKHERHERSKKTHVICKANEVDYCSYNI